MCSGALFTPAGTPRLKEHFYIRNTEHVFGCAVYTGRDTKMSKNSKTTANKFSTVEKTMNKVPPT